MEAEALDVGAVLLGDVALLVMAPLVIYAALKMIWEEQFEESEEAEEKQLDNLTAKSRSYLAASADLESSLPDPDLKEVATNAARNIVGAIRETVDNCMFDAGLEELAVKHGGREASTKWIELMLTKQDSIDAELIKQEVLERADELSAEDLCLLVSKLRAEKIAMQEIRKMIKVVVDRLS